MSKMIKYLNKFYNFCDDLKKILSTEEQKNIFWHISSTAMEEWAILEKFWVSNGRLLERETLSGSSGTMKIEFINWALDDAKISREEYDEDANLLEESLRELIGSHTDAYRLCMYLFEAGYKAAKGK